VLGLALGVTATRLGEPVRGRFEPAAPLRNASLRDAFARLNRIRTFSCAMIALGAFGVCAIAVPIYLSIVLNDQLGQALAARSVIGAVSSVGGLAGAALGGIYGDRLFRRSPTASLYLAGGALAALGVGFAVQAYSPDVVTFVVVGTLTQGLTFAGIVSLGLLVASITPVELRSTAFAFVGLYLAVFGGLGGAVLIALTEQWWGIRAAIAVVATAASIAAGVVLVSSAGHLERDIAGASTAR
jgi:MFS family permease